MERLRIFRISMIVYIGGLLIFGLSVLSSCNERAEKEPRVRFSITQEAISVNGDIVITTRISECENYQKPNQLVYVYKLIYTNEVTTDFDKVGTVKTAEMEKVDVYIHKLID